MPRVTAPILPGAEPFSQAGGPSGVLVLHGFTGNPQSLRPLAGALAAAGYTVDLPLLPGHGTTVEDMISTRWADWSGAAESAYEKLATGCDDVALVNPFIDPPAESFRDVLRAALDSGTDIAPGVGSDIKKEAVTELAYLVTPIAAALSFFEGIDATAADLGRVSCPILLLSSRNDHVVPSSSGDVLEAGVAGLVERVWLEDSYHVATLDNDAEEITARVLAFAGGILP
jgi:carboxylesterase